MAKLSPDTLTSPPWHPGGDRSPTGPTRWTASELVIPAILILLLFLVGARIMAAVAAGLAVTIIVLRHISPAARSLIDRTFDRLADWIGWTVTVILLAPVFFLLMPVFRLLNRLNSNDPLRLSDPDCPTFWLPCDGEGRRLRHVQRMFCTERLAPGRFSPLALVAGCLLLLGAAELGLSLYGLRDALLYVQDPEVGYYPRPDQRVRHPGRVITINHHGMRSPDRPAQKPPGKFRILMLGDSTLAGTYVSNQELYSTLLEQRLNAAAGRPVFEVMNMGVNAWGPHHQLAYVRKFGSFDADLALVCGPVANAYRPRYGLERLPFLPATRPPRLALEHVVYQLGWRLREGTLGPPSWSVGDAAQAQAGEGIEAYGRLVEELRRHGAEVLVEMLPPAPVAMGRGADPTIDRLFARLRERVSRAGADANCAGPVFRNVAKPGEIYHDGVHFRRLGHRCYAEYLAGQVRQRSPRVREVLERS